MCKIEPRQEVSYWRSLPVQGRVGASGLDLGLFSLQKQSLWAMYEFKKKHNKVGTHTGK